MRLGMTIKQADTGFQTVDADWKTGMLYGWLPPPNPSVFWTHTLSPGFDPRQASKVSSVIRRRESLPLPGAQKNSLWRLWPVAPQLVRSEDTPGTRLVLCRYPYLPVPRSPGPSVQGLRQGEAGDARLPGRQSAVHQALRLLRGPALPA